MTVIPSTDWQLLLHEGVIQNNIDLLQNALEHGAYINQGGSGYPPPLHTACEFNLPDIAHFLIVRGAKVNTVDENGHTPLQYACKGGYLAIIQILCERGAYLDPDSLYNAIENKHYECIEYLVRAKIEIKPQHFEIADDKCVDLIINGYGVEKIAGHCLWMACRDGEEYKVLKLISIGANVNTMVNDISCLSVAVINIVHVDIIKILLCCGARCTVGDLSMLICDEVGMKLCLKNINLDVEEWRALCEEIVCDGNISCLELVIVYGKHRGWEINSYLLFTCVERCLNDKLELLLQSGCNVNIVNQDGIDLLLYSSKHDNVEGFDILVKYGAKIDKRIRNFFSKIYLRKILW